MNAALAFAAAAVLGASASATQPSLECTSTPALAVDADGAPDSYRIDGRGLSFTCDGVFAVVNDIAQTQNNNKTHWQELCRAAWQKALTTSDYSHLKIVGFLKDSHGQPVVQSQGDPLPGQAFVTATALTIPGAASGAQRHYVNAREIPYVVLSSSWAGKYHLKPGDVVAVYRPSNQKLAYAVYGDCCSLGEASIRLHKDLGHDPIVVENGVERAKRGLGERVAFVPLTGAATTPATNFETWRAEINSVGQKALAARGGIEAVKACVARSAEQAAH